MLKKFLTTIAGMFLVLAPVAAYAGFSPDRPTYTYNGPGTPGADHVVFNSFINTPNYGDERTFFDGKDNANTSSGGYQDTISVTPGKEYLLRVYAHNNADPSLNASGAGIAHNTKVRVNLPEATDYSLRAIGHISADNASPSLVSDTVDFQNSSTPFSISYVPGSAKIYTNATPGGRAVSDGIVGAGALVGYDQNDGNVPGCFQYDMIITLKVKVNAPALEINKQVALSGSGSNYSEQINAKEGDTVTWLVKYKNNGTANVDNIVVRDTMPEGMELVAGSVKRFDSNHPSGEQLSDTGLFGNGVNVGSVAPGGAGYIQFKTKVKSLAANVCNKTITNQATVLAQGLPTLKDTAMVVISKSGCAGGGELPKTPSTPTSLPQTGGEAAGGLIGFSALGYSARAWIRSKRDLLKALKRNK